MRNNIYNGQYLSLILEEKGGKKREKVYLRDSVNLLLVDDSKNLFLLKESRWDKGGKKVIKLLSGLVDDGEKVSSAAKRELLEEVSITDVKLTKIFTYRVEGTINQNKHYFIANIKKQKEIPSDLCKFSLEDLHRMIKENFFGLSTTGALLRMLQKISYL